MKKTIADTIINKIKRGEIKMKSQVSILIEKLGLNSGIVAVLGMLVLIGGFILYWINSNNDLLFGGYGRLGLSSFVQSFPYLLMVVFIILFILLVFIFRTFDFSYKKPFFLILIIAILGVILLSWMSSKQPLGKRFYQQEGRRFGMGMMNNGNAVSGIVTELKTYSIIIENENNRSTKVNLNPNTHFPFGKPKVGNLIRVVGTWEGDIFNAFGVRIFDETNPSTLGPGMMHGDGKGRGMMRNR